MKETSVTTDWLEERGNLNDARVLGYSFEDDLLTLFLDDEWTNFEGLDGYSGPSPGALKIAGSKAADISEDVCNERLSDVTLEINDHGQLLLKIICYGGYQAMLPCTNVSWIEGASPAAAGS